MRVNKLDLERLKKEGRPPLEALGKLNAFVEANTKKKERPVFVAHNAPFDWLFLTYYYGHYGLDNPFGHSAIDTKALGMGKLDLPWNQTSAKNLVKHLPEGALPKLDMSELHHALFDARYSAHLFCALMNLKRS